MLIVPAVHDMISVTVDTEQTRDRYVAEAEQFLQGVQEYDVDFEQLRAFCDRYPEGMLLEKERAELTQAVEDFDYEAISRLLGQMIDLIKKD